MGWRKGTLTFLLCPPGSTGATKTACGPQSHLLHCNLCRDIKCYPKLGFLHRLGTSNPFKRYMNIRDPISPEKYTHSWTWRKYQTHPKSVPLQLDMAARVSVPGCFIWTTSLRARGTWPATRLPMPPCGAIMGHGTSLGCLTRPILLHTGPVALGKSPVPIS